MNYTIIIIILLILGFTAALLFIPGNETVFKGEYPSKGLSDETRQVLAPGLLSTGLNERDFAMNKGKDRILFAVMWPGYSVICETRRINGRWQKPQVATFSGNPKYFDAEPQFTPDGKRVYFLSNRPLPGDEYHMGWGYEHIWFSELTDGKWSEASPAEMKTEKGKKYFFPSFTKNGDMYLTVGTEGGPSLLSVARLKDGKWTRYHWVRTSTQAQPSTTAL